MDKQKMIDVLGQASLFELYRFRVLLHKMLEDPKKLDEVKAKLKLNQKIIYLDGGTNQEIIYPSQSGFRCNMKQIHARASKPEPMVASISAM